MAWVLLVWLAAVVFMAFNHVVWRDEVRALGLALYGDSPAAMLRHLSDGHPGLWHLMLRGAYWLVPTQKVLPVVAIAVSIAAALLLAWRSPFGWPVVALILFSRIVGYEYSVVARNYGISMLLMFVFAALYDRCRGRGLWLGLVLGLLANCNVHSALLVGAFLLFWLLDLATDPGPERRPALRNFAWNAGLALVGVALCALTVYAPSNDAAVSPTAGQPLAGVVLRALLLPGPNFPDVLRYFELNSLFGALLPAAWKAHYPLVRDALASALLGGATLGLLRRPPAWIAACLALLGLSCLFAVVYPGGFRHQGLWIVFLVSLYWIDGIAALRQAWRPGPWQRRIHQFGLACFGLLLVLQAVAGLYKIAHIASGEPPESRSRDLGLLIGRHPELAQATIVGDPDYLVEPLGYYMPNATYLLREHRYGRIVLFSKNGLLTLTLDDILREVRQLHEATHQPVVILLMDRIDPDAPAEEFTEGYNWILSTTPEQVARFLAATRRIERFDRACCSDETYDVYVFDGDPK